MTPEEGAPRQAAAPVAGAVSSDREAQQVQQMTAVLACGLMVARIVRQSREALRC